MMKGMLLVDNKEHKLDIVKQNNHSKIYLESIHITKEDL